MLVDGRCRPVRNKLSALPYNVKQPVVDIDALVRHPMVRVIRVNVLAWVTCF